MTITGTSGPWAYDYGIEQARQALASENALVRGLQQKTMASGSRGLARGEEIVDYEARLRAHLRAGNQLPSGVLPPSDTAPARAAASPGTITDFILEALTTDTRETQPEGWQPSTRMETLRRFVTSADERERAFAFQESAAIAEYEKDLRDFLAKGNPLPRGVIPPARHDSSATWSRSFGADWSVRR